MTSGSSISTSEIRQYRSSTVYLLVVWTSASKGYRHKKNSNHFVTPENVCLLTSVFLVTRFQAISVHYRPTDSHSYLLLSSSRLSHVQNSTPLILNFLYMLYLDVSVVMTSKMHFSDDRRITLFSLPVMEARQTLSATNPLCTRFSMF